jgi:signal transduction histidine kinase
METKKINVQKTILAKASKIKKDIKDLEKSISDYANYMASVINAYSEVADKAVKKQAVKKVRRVVKKQKYASAEDLKKSYKACK